ncbi:hypothetical protein KDA14_01810 [Candidatus Saccharibacteria bacterium]|nr:hypothetical protein [Candidatus Saccharibacteria bacterium]
MQDEKAQLRQELIEKRKNVPASTTQRAGAEALQLLATMLDWQAVQRVHLYAAVQVLGEIPTHAIQNWLAEAHPGVHVTVGEAKPGADTPPGDYDIIVVPVLGFDDENFRLGMGGGWYDRWLATQSQAQKIGLAYAWAKLETLPHEAHDIPLDIILEV